MIQFDQIIGHERPIRVLTSAIENDRIAHAYIFAGPDGIGKRTCALAFAASLNCETKSAVACGTCQSCSKISQDIHPDLVTVVPEGQFIKIDQIRDIGRQSHFAPYEGRNRVFLFLEAHKMNPNAANALLKTLEEPRPNNVLILETSNPQQLLPTILSRCQRINFNPLSPDNIEKWTLEKVQSDPATARLLARLSGGSIGWVMQADVESIIERRRELLLELATLDPGNEIAISAFADRMTEAGTEPETTFELLKTFLRDAALISGGIESDHLINIDIVDSIREYAARFSPKRLLAMGRSIGYAQRLLIRNVNKNLVAMSLALELVHPTGAGFDSQRMPR